MKLVAYSNVGAEMHRSGGYLECEHNGQTEVSTARCTAISHFVLTWVGKYSGTTLDRRLCTRHGLQQIKAAQDAR